MQERSKVFKILAEQLTSATLFSLVALFDLSDKRRPNEQVDFPVSFMCISWLSYRVRGGRGSRESETIQERMAGNAGRCLTVARAREILNIPCIVCC